MSVFVLDLEVYEAVYQKALSYTFRKEVDINYCETLQRFSEDELKELIKNWLWLNEFSHTRRYAEKGEDLETPELPKFLIFNRGMKINTYQMLKYLSSIYYNIEMFTIEKGKTGTEGTFLIPDVLRKSHIILGDVINKIKDRIIAEIPEYKKAKWSETT